MSRILSIIFFIKYLLTKIIKSTLVFFSRLKDYYKIKINKVIRSDIYCFNSVKISYNKKWYKNIKTVFLFVMFLLNTVKIFFLEIVFISFMFLILIYLSVNIYSSKYIYSNVVEIKRNDVGLVLGTSKYISDGQLNKYYTYRIEAAYNLYRAGKVNYLLVSGDNRSHRYNEPKSMFNDLVALGVPKERIYLDYAGFRTYDSIVRAKEVFGQTNFTVISQKFHNQRAIFIGKSKGLDIVGYNARDVNKKFMASQFPRELLSRALMYSDIITGRHPYFYGNPIHIGKSKQKP